MTCTYKFRYAPLELFLLFLQGRGIFFFCITTNTRAPKKKIQARCYHNNSQRIILLAIFFFLSREVKSKCPLLIYSFF